MSSQIVHTSEKLQKYIDESQIDGCVNELLNELRELRTLATKSKETQKEICENPQLLTSLVTILNYLLTTKNDDENFIVSFWVGVQCLINLIVQNEFTQKFVWNKFGDDIKKWLTVEDVKGKNYVFALYYNIFLPNKDLVKDFIANENQVKSAVSSASKETEFSQFLLELCLDCGGFIDMFNILMKNPSNSEQIYLIVLLDSVVTKTEDIKYLKEIEFLSQRFKRLSDQILKTIPESVEKVDLGEVSALLQLIAHVTSVRKFQINIQKDKSLVINCMYLLIGMHRARQKDMTPGDEKAKEAAALEGVISALKETSLEDKSPEFNFKGNLVRIIGNCSYLNKEIQDLVRELECLPVVLECCNIDPNNPFIREWSIFAIKCICEGNAKNQDFISCMKSFVPTDIKKLPEERIVNFVD